MRRIGYNENYFSMIDTPDKSYFLGFIFADGCIQTINRKQLIIKIHPKDIDVLYKFKECIEFEGDVYHDKKRNICQIGLSGSKIISDLLSHGLIQNKTKTLEYPNITKDFEIDFIRGFFDGDGCISIKTDRRTGHKSGNLTIVCGSINFLNKLNERMSNIFNIRLNKLYGPKYKTYKFINWGGLSDIESIYEKMYTGSVFMNRKKEIFDEVYKIHQSKNKYRK
jgi:hypothetical protein